jgi:AraC family transcriptional regulator of adaptative response/methylated-DNA-[protein]-cysteine methyltransferase
MKSPLPVESTSPLMHSVRIETILGACWVLFSAQGIHALRFSNSPKAGAALPKPAASLPAQWTQVIQAAACGGKVNGKIPLAPKGTAFQQKVWTEIARIPRGQTVHYGEIAHAMGSPKAVRAVGVACGRNPIALLIPCHRVVRKDGSLGGYAWGVERKQRLLLEEKQKCASGE